MKVSVIIPAYNRAQRLTAALESIKKQTSPADEVIVVDDGSTDETPSLFRHCHPDIEYIQQPRQGVSKARNTGIIAARNEWLAFLDSDDKWLPEKLHKQLNILKLHPDYKICHTDEIWVRHGVRVNAMRKHKKYGGNIFRKCLPLCVISPSSILIHRSVFEDVGLFDENLVACEDYDMWLRICARYKVLYLDEQLLMKYGGHEDQLSRQHWGMDRFRIHALEKIINTNTLMTEDKSAAVKTLLKKISIFLNGAKKRSNNHDILVYEKKYQYYISLLSEGGIT